MRVFFVITALALTTFAAPALARPAHHRYPISHIAHARLHPQRRPRARVVSVRPRAVRFARLRSHSPKWERSARARSFMTFARRRFFLHHRWMGRPSPVRFARMSAPSPAAVGQARAGDLAAIALRYVGGRDPTGFRGEWCGDFMGFVARRAGRATPPDFRLARAWARAGARLSQPVPGALMVMNHHVGIVLKAQAGRVLLVSGNHGRRVGVGWYDARRAIAYVALGRTANRWDSEWPHNAARRAA